MKSFKNIEKWADKKNRKIALSHEKKDRKALLKTLSNLKDEQGTIKKELHFVDYLLDLTRNVGSEDVKKPQILFDDYGKYKGWLKKLEKKLKELSKKSDDELTDAEKEFLESEKSRLENERSRLEKHLKVVDELIAKNQILLIDVEEAYCNELSNGHSIASVAGILKDEFGSKLEKGYSSGYRTFVKLLEKKLNISRKSATELIDLLIERKVLNYSTTIPREDLADNMVFYTPYIDDFFDEVDALVGTGTYVEPMVGTWLINS